MRYKWKPKFYRIEFDIQAYMKTLLQTLREANDHAGKAWIKAATDGPPIPTWNGASRATFLKLARELGTSVSIGPIRGGTNNISDGISSSSGSRVIEDLRKDKYYVGFIYETVLGHLIYNEYNRPVPGRYPKPYSTRVRNTPYGFQDRAEQAWQKEANKVKLPNPKKYLNKRKI